MRDGKCLVEAILGDEGGPESGLSGQCEAFEDWIDDSRNGRG